MTAPSPPDQAEAIPAACLAGFRHGFFTRRGGVSSGHYASLNGSVSGADDPADVHANRTRIASRLDLPVERLLGITQVHGIEVATVLRPWGAGEGPRADAMVTATGGIGLAIVTADCAPVLLGDRRAGVVGAAHAGWRGAAAGVIEAALDAMERLGATRAGIVAAIGPCIGQASYEVGTDMRDATLRLDPQAGVRFAPGRDAAHLQFDLAGFCADRLARAGVDRIEILGLDTCAESERFFSHRRRTLAGGHPIGHQVSVIRL